MDNQKKLTKEVSLVLYGGGEVGNNCYKCLKEQGYHVAAALDQNKSGEHVIEGIYTYKLGTEPVELDKSNCIVMICLANGMIHKAVADTLYRQGYSYIIFLPINHCIPDEQKRKLTKLYNYVLLADPAMVKCAVSGYEQYAIPNMEIENSIIRKTSQNITVWMRLEMLFSESLELWQGDKTKIYTKAIYKDKNIACGNPCEALFNYFALKEDSYDAYFDSKKVQKNQEEKEKELGQREALYRSFRREHEKGMDFFIEGAPEVVWNPKNYCNLVGGHHRTLYLLHEGHNLFPVKMRHGDFDKWYHEEVFQELKKYICKNQIEQFYAPLPHPCFLNFPVQWEDTGRTKLAAVMHWIANVDITDMTVLDCGNDEGYFARNMDRIGAKESVFLNNNVRQIELADLFNRLLYRNDVQIAENRIEDFNENQRFDIIFVLGGNDTKNMISKPWLERIGVLCSRYLIIETTKSEEVEQIKAYTGLENYVCLHREYKTGQIWELGVYSRRKGVSL